MSINKSVLGNIMWMAAGAALLSVFFVVRQDALVEFHDTVSPPKPTALIGAEAGVGMGALKDNGKWSALRYWKSRTTSSSGAMRSVFQNTVSPSKPAARIGTGTGRGVVKVALLMTEEHADQAIATPMSLDVKAGIRHKREAPQGTFHIMEGHDGQLITPMSTGKMHRYVDDVHLPHDLRQLFLGVSDNHSLA